jgi:hypothetical protein
MILPPWAHQWMPALDDPGLCHLVQAKRSVIESFRFHVSLPTFDHMISLNSAN